MGALVSSAVPRLRCPEEANLRAPDAVVSLHVGFINAGAELIETNTFGANRRKLAHYFLEDDFERINSTAVKLARDAREVTGREVFVAGSIGPLGESVPTRERRELFADQASVLEGRGADTFMVETFYDLDELVDAIEAVRSVSSLPIVALLTFDEGAETLAGVTAREAGERLVALDVAAIGANHGAGLLAALAALEQFQTDGLPLAALPNIGLASLAGGRVIFPHATPDYFAEFAAHARDLGARVIGGCCGTTPTEIAAIRAAVDEERVPRAALQFEERELVVSLGEEQGESQLQQAFPAGGGGDYPGSRGIYEVDSIGLTRLIASLNRGEDVNGRPIDAPTSFYIGVAVNPSADDLDFELDRFQQKIDAGARFAMTQLVFDLDYLDRFLDRIGGSPPIPLLLGVCPLWSYRLALRFHNELPGIIVPEPLQDALRDAGADAADVGMAHAKRLLSEARDR